jgi:hypothetical protein
LATNSRFQLLITPRSLAMASFVMTVVILVDALVPQMEMFATGGHILIPPAVLKPLFAAILLPAVLWQPRSIRITVFSAAWLALMIYLMLDVLYLMLHFQTSFVDVALAYNGYYAYFFVCPLAVFVANELDEFRATKVLFWVFAACFALGMAQFILQKPLVYLRSSDGMFTVQAPQFGEGIRVFSLFAAGLSYGIFCNLIGALSLAWVFYSKGAWRKVALFVFLCSVIACYTTLTRNSYLQFFFCCVTVVLLAKGRLVGLVKYLPIVFLIGSILLAWRGAGIMVTEGDVTSNNTLILRLAQWIYYLTLYSNAPPLEKILGLGIAQSDKVSNDALFVIDNEFVAFLIHIGIVGLVLVLAVQWLMWIRLYKRSIQLPTAFTIAMAAFSSTVFAANFYNLATVPYCIVFALGVIMYPATRRRRLSAPGGRVRALSSA